MDPETSAVAAVIQWNGDGSAASFSRQPWRMPQSNCRRPEAGQIGSVGTRSLVGGPVAIETPDGCNGTHKQRCDLFLKTGQ
jgi:hypothetical protein